MVRERGGGYSRVALDTLSDSAATPEQVIIDAAELRALVSDEVARQLAGQNSDDGPPPHGPPADTPGKGPKG